MLTPYSTKASNESIIDSNKTTCRNGKTVLEGDRGSLNNTKHSPTALQISMEDNNLNYVLERILGHKKTCK